MVPLRLRDPRRSSTGQALVETALLLPILLILLLGAVDFGRLFFGWVNLHQAVRIGANFAATHPNMTASERDELVFLIEGDTAALNCELEDPLPNPTYATAGGAPTTTPSLGDYATFAADCDFSLITPLAGLFFGDTIDMSATSTFPVREGCVNCPTPAPVPPPATPIQCRLVPTLTGLSVEGARQAWAAAGFLPDKFTPPTGQDHSTVQFATVTQSPLSTCTTPNAIFDSTVVVTILGADETDPSCITVPNVIGLSVADAQAAWTDVGFTGAFTVDGGGDPAAIDTARIVTDQDTTPDTTEGVTCELPTTTIDATTGDPRPPAPPVPCRVPNLINLKLDEGRVAWAAAGFDPDNLTADGRNNFNIKSQSLVGGNYVTCGATITVSSTPAGGPP
jgi:hypothetical protein